MRVLVPTIGALGLMAFAVTFAVHGEWVEACCAVAFSAGLWACVVEEHYRS